MSRRRFLSIPPSLVTASSLQEAYSLRMSLQALKLSNSPDLRCINIMCEKVGKGCACRLALTLERITMQVTEIDISHNKLGNLPESLWACGLLRRLNLAGNDIAKLPLNMASSLKNLEHLDISGTRIDAVGLPPSCLPTELRSLDLSETPAAASTTYIKSLKDAHPSLQVISTKAAAAAAIGTSSSNRLV